MHATILLISNAFEIMCALKDCLFDHSNSVTIELLTITSFFAQPSLTISKN